MEPVQKIWGGGRWRIPVGAKRATPWTREDKVTVGKIAFVTPSVPRYKVWFFEQLECLLAGRFYLLHGPEKKGSLPRDVGWLGSQWDVILRNKYFVVNDIVFTWIPCVAWVLRNRCEVIILVDGTRVLSNYVVHFLGKMMGSKILYYTHGYNHQGELTRGVVVRALSERIRRFLLKRSDALLLYTPGGATYLRAKGVLTKSFVFNNTLDTLTICSWYSDIDQQTIDKVRCAIGAAKDRQVIMFLGRLVPEKNVTLFIDVIRALCALPNSAYLGLIIGDGPLMEQSRAYSKGLPVAFVGHQSGRNLGKYLASGDCVFMPRHVGLALVEAFCAGKPFITCHGQYHGPEIEYVRHGVNGLILGSLVPSRIAIEIDKLLKDAERSARIGREARRTARALQPSVSVNAVCEAVAFVRSPE